MKSKGSIITNYLLLQGVCTFAFLVFGCAKTDLADHSGIELFHVKDYGVPLQNADIDTLELEGPSIINREDILYYDMSTNTFVLNADRDEVFEGLLDEEGYFTDALSPFIFTINHKAAFLGYFMSTNTAIGIDWPYIIADYDFFTDSVINISTGYNVHHVRYIDKLRSDTEMKRLFLSDKLVKPGITVILDSIFIAQGPDTSTITYFFNITNDDKTDLYVPDPFLMGNSVFNKYTLGVVLDAPGKTYYARYLPYSSDNLQYYEYSWYRKMKPGEKIYRSATVKGYKPIDPGIYTCFFCFAGPVSIDNMIQPDGSRYWFGWTDSNVIEVEVSK